MTRAPFVATTARTEPGRIGPAAAQLLGWLALALLNQVLASLLLPSSRVEVRLLHHAYDAGHLMLLGALSWGAVAGVRYTTPRFGWSFAERRHWQAALVGVVGFCVGITILGPDGAGFAERTETSPAWVTLALATVTALALGVTRWLSAPSQGWLRAGLGLVGAMLATLNGLHLENDYFAYHLLLAWFSASLIAGAVEGLAVRAWTRRVELAAVGVMALAGALAVVFPPGGDVRVRLFMLPSSALAPHLARFMPQEPQHDDAVPARYRDSPWFRDRAGLPEVPATRAIVPARAPIVLFFTVDAFRADLIENREHRSRFPNFSRLYRHSTYFDDAHTPTTSTMTTMAATFTGRYYTQLLWQRTRKPLIDTTPRFPELLQRAGVQTALFAGAQGRIHGHTGVALGFTTDVTVRTNGIPAKANVDAIIDYLDKAPRGPTFVYSHFIEPHSPYTLGGKNGSSFERYLREVALVDREVGRLRAFLDAKGLADDTYIILSADHGEAFGEHASHGHAKTVYEEQSHVPFFFFLPGRQGQRLSAPITLMDVGPTVLDLFGLPTPGHWMSQSLLPLVAGKKTALERVVAMDTGRDVQAIYFEDRYKVIFNRNQRTTECYDLKTDPGELNNLFIAKDARAREAVDSANLFFARIRRRTNESAPVADSD